MPIINFKSKQRKTILQQAKEKYPMYHVPDEKELEAFKKEYYETYGEVLR